MSRWLLGLAVLALLTAGLWLDTRNNRFPYYYHPDEPKKVRQVQTGERNFNHPLLLLTASEALWKCAGKPAGPQQIVELGRWISALFCTVGTIFFALAAWSWRGPLAGLVTGTLLLLNHQVFELAHYMKEDPALYLGAGLTVWMLVLCARHKSPGTVLALGGAVGVAASGKYLGVILLVPAMALVVRSVPGKKAKNLAWLVLALVAVFFIINFRLFTELPTFLQSFTKEMDWAVQGQKELTRSVPHPIYLNIFVENTTPVIWALLVFLGIDLWRRRGKIEPLAWCLVGTLLGWLLLLSFSPKTNDRYFLPLTGLSYLLAGAGAASLWQRVKTKGRAARTACGFFLLAGAVWDGVHTVHFARAFAQDDRAELVAWILKNIPASQSLAYDARVNLPDEEVYRELAQPLPHRLLRETFVADIGSREELRKREISYVVVTESTYGRFFLDSLRPKEGGRQEFDRRAAFYRALLSRPPLWKKDRSEVLYLHPGLEVYGLAN